MAEETKEFKEVVEKHRADRMARIRERMEARKTGKTYKDERIQKFMDRLHELAEARKDKDKDKVNPLIERLRRAREKKAAEQAK